MRLVELAFMDCMRFALTAPGRRGAGETRAVATPTRLRSGLCARVATTNTHLNERPLRSAQWRRLNSRSQPGCDCAGVGR